MANTNEVKSTEELTLFGVIDRLAATVKNMDEIADKAGHIKSKLKADPLNKPSEQSECINTPASLPEKLNGIVNDLLYVTDRIYGNLSTIENIIG